MAPLSRLVLTAATLLLTSVSAQAVTRYRVTDLGDLPGGTDHSYALGINDAGQVVGVGNHRPSSDSAFLWTASRGMQNLGANFSAAVDINNAGQIVGERYFANQNQAFLWTASRGMQALPLTRALGINRTGQVVGSNDSGVSLWTASGGVKALGIFGDGEAINNAGQVVGWDRDGGAFLWTASRGLQHLGQLPGGV
jgi:probable HAF family extracellular repeat protein